MLNQILVVLKVVGGVSELLCRFDVDCAAVAFEPGSGKAYMTPRAKRAFETGCNILDSRFNSASYANRLWKYANRGFGVAVPGLDLQLISPRIAQKKYIYIVDKDMLLRIDRMGRFSRDQMNIEFDGKQASIVYSRCDEASKIDGLMKFVIMDSYVSNGDVRCVSLPKIKECAKCGVRVAEPAVNTDSPLLLYTGISKKYHLLWNASLLNDHCDNMSSCLENDCNTDVVEDVAGYTCTPLALAYDLFNQLLELQLIEEDTSTRNKCGVVARLSADMHQQNGEVTASVCRRHYDKMMGMKGRVGFVWELVNANMDNFDSLNNIFDAGSVPVLASAIMLSDKAFERNYGFPRMLRFERAELRSPTTIDWYSDVY